MRILICLMLLANICEAQFVGAPRRGGKMTAAPMTETDPSVSDAAKSIQAADIAKWNNANSWGNHALAGYLKSVSWANIQSKPNTLSGFGITDAYPLTGNPSGFITGINSQQIISALGFTPYNATNPNNYISSISSQAVTNALGFTPLNGDGTALQYIAGNGNKVLFPSIPAAQVQSDWNAVSGMGVILNKPTIPAAVTQTSQLTNNSGFLTSINSSQVATALGFTPVNYTAGTGITISSGVISATTPATVTYTYNYPTRPINSTAFQISTTREAIVTYSVQHSVALTLVVATGGSTVYLETSANGTTGWQVISSAGYTESLGVGVSVNKSITSNVQGIIPIGYYARLRTVTTGGGSITYSSGQERF